MDSQQTLNTYLTTYVPLIEQHMRRVIQESATGKHIGAGSANQPAAFATMLNYHLGFCDADGAPTQMYSGKRIRPILTLLSCEACGGSAMQAMSAATAVELLHNFSLIHDDIEDRDILRRGRPTLWKLWGDAQAINTGDAMFALAHMAMEVSPAQGIDAAQILHALTVFDEACVALTVGQHLDLSFESRTDVSSTEYMEMIQGKTGALTQAACAIGAILAGASEDRISALAQYGAWLGIAFQLQDDVLGIWGDPELTGKTGSDLSHRKKTLPVLYAAERNPQVRDLYFRDGIPSDEDLDVLRQVIDASDSRSYTERAALDAYSQSMAALASAQLAGPAATALHDLANSLLGREA